MRVKISPSKNLIGPLTLPPSKSLGHRLIIGACLSEGVSIINNVDFSKDILATIDAMKTMGANIKINDNQLIIEGIKELTLTSATIDCNESGSTLRFLIPLVSLTNQEVKLVGKGRLLQRPQTVYEDIFKAQGLAFSHNEEDIRLKGSLKSGSYLVDGNISSQFISGLLFALPLLKGDSVIEIKEPFESKSYVLLTIDILKRYKIDINLNNNKIYIKGNQKYQALNDSVESDYSQLAFFSGLGILNSELVVNNMNIDSLQGDKAIISIIKDFKASFDIKDDGYHFYPSKLVGTKIGLKDCPDLGPMLMAIACFAEGDTHITNANRLRIKESDRIGAMSCELNKLGANIRSDDNNIYIKGGINTHGNVVFDGHNDHRIVMAMSIVSTLCENACMIEGSEAISKSYPGFFKDLEKLGIGVEYED